VTYHEIVKNVDTGVERAEESAIGDVGSVIDVSVIDVSVQKEEVCSLGCL
jgi:hypothetical protein